MIDCSKEAAADEKFALEPADIADTPKDRLAEFRPALAMVLKGAKMLIFRFLEVTDVTTRQQTWLIAFVMVIGVYGVLAMANIAPLDPRTACEWKFPKALSCLLGARENLTGGLIGGAGALFAAWVAWLAVRHQIRSEILMRQQADAERRQAELNYRHRDIEELNERANNLERSIATSRPIVQRFELYNRDDVPEIVGTIVEMATARKLEQDPAFSSKIGSIISSLSFFGKFEFTLIDQQCLDMRDWVLKLREQHRREIDDLAATRVKIVELRRHIEQDHRST